MELQPRLYCELQHSYICSLPLSDIYSMCGGLIRYSPYRLLYLNAELIESGTIMRCGLAGGSALLWWWALRSPLLFTLSVT